MAYSASEMFVSCGIPSFYELLRKCIFDFSERISKNTNSIIEACLPITKNTTAVFVVYILQIHIPRWFSPTKNPFYYDYSITITFTIPIVKSTTAVIVELYLYHIS